MALRDTSWIMDTGGTLLDSHGIVTQEEYAVRKLIDPIFGWTGTQTVHTQTQEWINLTSAASNSAITSLSSSYDTNQTWTRTETDRITGAWKVTRAIDSRGSWS